jgi:hypothetical protein
VGWRSRLTKPRVPGYLSSHPYEPCRTAVRGRIAGRWRVWGAVGTGGRLADRAPATPFDHPDRISELRLAS